MGIIIGIGNYIGNDKSSGGIKPVITFNIITENGLKIKSEDNKFIIQE